MKTNLILMVEVIYLILIMKILELQWCYWFDGLPQAMLKYWNMKHKMYLFLDKQIQFIGNLYIVFDDL